MATDQTDADAGGRRRFGGRGLTEGTVIVDLNGEYERIFSLADRQGWDVFQLSDDRYVMIPPFGCWISGRKSWKNLDQLKWRLASLNFFK